MTELSYGDKAPETINLVIEIRQGERNKYEFDKDTGRLFLDRVNGTAMGYPTDYGYVPNTLCGDGDPLDGLLVIDESVPHGTVVPARPIGVLYLIDDGEADEKLICVPADDVSKDHIKDLSDLGENFPKVIEHFYSHYKDWKNGWKGVEMKFNGWGDATAAKQVITQSIELVKNK
ncbi:inorganic diphosphatase [Patescibacteria group bacterium]|nr:inorganic diphosphatase [Patescibacteria group bacterium]